MKPFNHFQNTRLFFGAGRVEEAGKIIGEYGKNCLLATTSSRNNGPLQSIYARVIQILEESNLTVTHFDGVTPNPTTEDVSRGAEMARAARADVVVGLGGGSSMDVAKAIAVEATHEGSSWDYLFYKKQPTEKTLPIVAISTTSGTGSQVTQVSVVTNTNKRDKSALYHDFLFPRAAIIDPELMISVPSTVTAATGFDVFCHAFESLLHPNRGAYVDLLAREAVRIVFEYLPKVLKEPLNVEWRSTMAWADTMAGLCIANAGVTLPHGMGMAIGGMYPHVAHGQALAIVYPACINFTWEKAIEPHAFVSRALNPKLNEKDDYEAAKMAAGEISKFLQEINLYQKLKEVNVPPSELETLARQCMALPDYENNPRVASYAEMIELVEASYG